jgi:hypothetical protein
MTDRQLRHFCRNPRCRMKLAAPTENERCAFCTSGCHKAFHRKHCLVCERSFAGLDQGRSALVGVRPIKHRESRRFCSPKCSAAYRQNPRAYQFRPEVAPAQVKASGTPVNTGFETRLRTWGPTLSPTALRLASLPLDPVTEARVARANRLPEVLPQNLLPQTAVYLAGLMEVMRPPLAIFQRNTPPLNLIGGYRWPEAVQLVEPELRRSILEAERG